MAMFTDPAARADVLNSIGTPALEQLEVRVMLSGDVLSAGEGEALMMATPFALEFSLDIGSDIELSDPFMDGDEAADPGDVYIQGSGPIRPPGRDGFKDDERLFGVDPLPDPSTIGFPPAVVPVGEGRPDQYPEYFDLDGHDQIDITLQEFIPPDHPLPIPAPFFGGSGCIYPVRYLAVSYDDDQAPGWPAGDVPTTVPSAAGTIYGTTGGQDEVVGVTVCRSAPRRSRS